MYGEGIHLTVAHNPPYRMFKKGLKLIPKEQSAKVA